jgi:hypothetical protein
VVFFLFAGVGFGGVAVAAGCVHGIITFPSTPLYATVKGLTFCRCNNWRGVQGPEALLAYQTFELQGRIFSALVSHLDTDLVHLFVKPNRKNAPLPKSSKKSYIWSWLCSVLDQAEFRYIFPAVILRHCRSVRA